MARSRVRFVWVATVAAAMLATLAEAGPARAAGVPVLGFGSRESALPAGGGVVYRTRPAGRRDTTVEAVGILGGGGTLGVRLPGSYTMPVVAYDGARAGLSADGRTLVLVRPRLQFPQRSTSMVILDARTLSTERYLRLRGDFSFDAISPSGRWLYLIQYTSSSPTDYRVRALDARDGMLIKRPIVDPREPDETMRGTPLARVYSADGRWAYTLYDGSGHPFVHALDTVRLTARCIDVASFPVNSDYFAGRLRFGPDHRRLLETFDGRTLATLDPTTFHVTVLRTGAHPARRAAASPPQAGRAGAASPAQSGRPAATSSRPGGAWWIAFPVAVAVLIIGAALLALRRRLGPAARPSRDPT